MNETLNNAMKRQVFSLPELIREQYEDLEPKTRSVLTTPEIFSIQRIVLTGCGDSYAAALAVKHAFEMLTKIPTEVVTALELARLYDRRQLGFAPLNPLVVAVSNSGGIARVSEAVQCANLHGAFTLGITSNEASPLGKNAGRLLKLDIPPFESAPGVRSYLTAVLALLLTAIRIGEVRGCYSMDEAAAMRQDIPEQGKQLQARLAEMDRQMLEVARDWKTMQAFDFVGAGFDYAAAWYGHAKILEAVGKSAMHINSEEWLHLNLFLRDAGRTGTVLVANTTNPCHSRNREVLLHMARLRPTVVITDGGKADFGAECVYVRVPSARYPILMPLTQFPPLALLAGYLQTLLGEEAGRGCKGPWEFCTDGAGVTQSGLVIE